MIEWPNQLKKDLIARRVVVLIGAGVSRNSLGRDNASRPPLWKEFLQAAVDQLGPRKTRHISSAIKDRDYLHACEWIKRKMEEDWEPFLRERFQAPIFSHARIHEAIFRLDQRVYLTVNFDQIFETYVNSETNGQVIVKKYYDDDVHKFLRDEANYIIKVHGSIEDPGRLIFTHQDYAMARIKYSAFYNVLDACLLSHTFLIIGCGINDPDFSLLLENQKFNFPGSRPHYFVTPSGISKDLIDSLRTNRNLKCITYNSADDHLELCESLVELAGIMDDVVPSIVPDLGVFG